MPQVEKLKIFLASPSDVAKERCYVEEVIKDINDTVASSKDIVLELVHSGKTYPGYGEDGQAVLNAQIANMEEYALFVGIMWNRVGTPTPRAESGTVEEFERAIAALERKGQPHIWFYFRQSPAQLNTEGELEQRQKVLEFKKKVQCKALTHDYKKPSNFRDQFRKDISLWLNKRPNKTSRSRTAAANRSKKSSVTPTNSQPPIAGENKQKKSSSTSPAADEKRRPSATSTTKKRSLAASRSTTRTIRSISSSDAWVMLNDNLFLTKSVETQPNQIIILQIPPATPKQEAALRKLQPEQYGKKTITYVYQNEAAIMQVDSVQFRSILGKNLFILTLSPDRRSQGNSIMEMNLNGYSADRIAEFRARLLLLNEAPNVENKNDFSMIEHFVEGYNYEKKIDKNLFPNLWKCLKADPSIFLRHARLAAIYHLKMSRTVEHIFELKLGPIKGDTMSVQFHGQRKPSYFGQEPVIIQFKGTCLLDG